MTLVEFFSDEKVKRNLVKNNLHTFQLIWSLETGWFEERNVRRGGWSGVSLYEMINKNSIFIKRQENHCYRAWNNFFMLDLTFHKEFENIQKFMRFGIPTLDVLYFGQRKERGKLQAILVTKELEGFLPLNSELLKNKLSVDFKFRKMAIRKVAEVMSHMHKQHLQHNCLYEKHVFLKQFQDGTIDVRLIDLEKVKWTIFKSQAMYRDLGTLYRHSKGWSKTDCLRFFLCYQQENRLNKQLKKQIHVFSKKEINRSNKKQNLML